MKQPLALLLVVSPWHSHLVLGALTGVISREVVNSSSRQRSPTARNSTPSASAFGLDRLRRNELKQSPQVMNVFPSDYDQALSGYPNSLPQNVYHLCRVINLSRQNNLSLVAT